MSAKCGAIRPRDGMTPCNRAPHNDENYEKHIYSQPNMRECEIIEWSRDGTEWCFACGAQLDAAGRCMAPIAGDD